MYVYIYIYTHLSLSLSMYVYIIIITVPELQAEPRDDRGQPSLGRTPLTSPYNQTNSSRSLWLYLNPLNLSNPF